RSSRRCARPATARSPRNWRPSASSTTPRTTTSSISTRCRTATADWARPGCPARSGSASASSRVVVTGGWGDYALVEVADARAVAAGPGPVTLQHGGREYLRVGDTGWYMTVCWCAGPGHVVRVWDQPQWHTVRTRVWRGDAVGSGQAWRTEAD